MYLINLKIDAKFEEKLIFCFKNDKKLVQFDLSIYKSLKPALSFARICKIFNVWPMTLRGDAKFEKNWLVVWKMTRGIWQIFIRALESLKTGILMGSFNPEEKRYEIKIQRGVMCYDNEDWCKIWREIDLSFQNWHEEFDEFWPKHWKVSKNFILMCSFWAKYLLFEIKKSTEKLSFMKLKRDTKFEEESACRFKNFHFKGLLLSKLYILWAEKVQRSYLSWN